MGFKSAKQYTCTIVTEMNTGRSILRGERRWAGISNVRLITTQDGMVTYG
jgi:hypothetical protein